MKNNINPKEVKYSITWKSSNGYYALAHCPVCGSSFACEEFRIAVGTAVNEASKNLISHIEAVHVAFQIKVK